MRLGRSTGFTALALVSAELAACGIDGVTPDCSDAAVCAPAAGDAASRDANVGRETGSEASVSDAQTSVVIDAGSDGG